MSMQRGHSMPSDGHPDRMVGGEAPHFSSIQAMSWKAQMMTWTL